MQTFPGTEGVKISFNMFPLSLLQTDRQTDRQTDNRIMYYPPSFNEVSLLHSNITQVRAVEYVVATSTYVHVVGTARGQLSFLLPGLLGSVSYNICKQRRAVSKYTGGGGGGRGEGCK